MSKMQIKVHERSGEVAGIKNFIDGMTDECTRCYPFNEGLPEELVDDLPAGWKEHDSDRNTMLATCIKYRGVDSYLDNIDAVSDQQRFEIVDQENQDFLQSLIDMARDDYGIDLFVFGRMGGWLGFNETDFAKKFITFTFKDDEATCKAVADKIRDLYGSDWEFDGNESLEELVISMDINDWSEGSYVFDGNFEWFTPTISSEGLALLEKITKAIDDQEAYMLTKEWYDEIKDRYDVENGEAD